MKLFIIDYQYKLVYNYGQAIVMAIDELHACQLVHIKHTVGVASNVCIIHVTEVLKNIVITK